MELMESEKSDKMDRTGKIAVVTGAGGTLCSIIAEDLASQGYRVVLVGRTREKLEVTEKAILEKGGTCISLTADVKDLGQMTALSKAGISNFTQWLAAYLAPANIRVNAVAPGFFLNDRSRKMLLDPDSESGYSPRGANIIRQTPMKRFGEARQLLGCVNWLIDDEKADFVTGITVPVDGGFLSDSGL